MLVGPAIVLAVVLALLALGLLRRRGTPTGERRRPRPGTTFVAISGVVVPTAVLIALFVLTVDALPTTSPNVAKTKLAVEVVGRQWFWDVSYAASGARTANEIHIPVGVPVDVRVTSRDVVHSLWVTELNRKIDAIPGRTNHVGFDARRPGIFRAQCAEFCGLQHAHMALYVVAEPRAESIRPGRSARSPIARPRRSMTATSSTRTSCSGDDRAAARAGRIASFRCELRAFLRHSEQVARRWQLTPQRYLLLLTIKGAPDGSERLTVSEIADHLALSLSAVTELYGRAEEAGLVRREESTSDLRLVYLRLTEEGERRLRGALVETEGYRDDLVRSFTGLSESFRVATGPDRSGFPPPH